MNWDPIVNKVTPHIVKIETQSANGTGFLFLSVLLEKEQWYSVATAMHVVGHAHKWQQPIQLRHHSSGKTVFLKADERIIVTDKETDSAVILFLQKDKSEFSLPDNPIPLFPNDSPLSIGVEVGWLGFPNVDPNELCFFSGKISANLKDRKAYFIDGVAIHGVSGGPVFFSTKTDGVQIVGTVSAYQANRATGETLPGLLIAQNVSHFHDTTRLIQSLKKKELEATQREPVKPVTTVQTQPPAPAPATQREPVKPVTH